MKGKASCTQSPCISLYHLLSSLACSSYIIGLVSKYQRRYLTEEKFKSPVIVYNYPKAIKAFYMKVNEDNKTVAAMDVLVPKVLSPIHVSYRNKLLSP